MKTRILEYYKLRKIYVENSSFRVFYTLLFKILTIPFAPAIFKSSKQKNLT